MIWFPILHRVNRRRGVNNNKDSPTDAEQNNTLNVLQYSIVKLKWKFKLPLAVYGVEHITAFVECLCPDKCSLGRVYGVWSTKAGRQLNIAASNLANKMNRNKQVKEHPNPTVNWTDESCWLALAKRGVRPSHDRSSLEFLPRSRHHLARPSLIRGVRGVQSAVSCWRVVTPGWRRDGDTRHVMDTLYSVLIVSTVHCVYSNADIDENEESIKTL